MNSNIALKVGSSTSILDNNSMESQLEEDDTNWEKPHPLKQMLILLNIIEHLDSDKKNLKVFRQVCTTWNMAINFSNVDLPILIKRNMTAFNTLLSQPQAKLSCRKVTLGANLDLGSGQSVTFLETQGHEIQKLKAKCDINDLSFLFLPKFCPNLVKLNVQPNFLTSDFQIPNLLKQTWENPFPCLKFITIRLSISRIPYPMIPCPLRRATLESNKLTTMANITQFFAFFLPKAMKLKQLNLVNWDAEYWQSITTAISHRPEIVESWQRIEVLHLNFFKFEPNPIESLAPDPSLNIRILEIQTFPSSMRTEVFSEFLQIVAPTLEVLNMKQHRSFSPEWPIDFRLIFPCEMKKLRSLEIKWVTMIPSNICSGTKGGNECNLFEVLPNLRNFSEEHCLITSFYLHGRKDFWKNAFPETSVDDGFVQNALVQFESSCRIPFQFVEKLALCVPKLKKCALIVEGETMREVVTKLNGCEIASLHVIYYSSEKGLNGLFSVISGISFEDCMNPDALEIEKTSTSLADWKALRDLTILYGGSLQLYIPFNREPIKSVCIEGFAKSIQLRRLAMKGFEMDSAHITTILDSIPLLSFDFDFPAVVVGSPEQGDTNNIQALRNKYRGVTFNGGFFISRGDLRRFDVDPEDEGENYEDGF